MARGLRITSPRLSGNDVVTGDRDVRKNDGIPRGRTEEDPFPSRSRETDFVCSFPVISKDGQCENTRGHDDKSYEEGEKRGDNFPLLPFTLGVVL